MSLDMTLNGARVLTPEGWDSCAVPVSGGVIADCTVGRAVDLSGYDLLPGLVDAHGDGFERHMAPRRGALRERDAGMLAVAAELAACGITTAVIAQFWSWEGGLRGPEFAREVFESVDVMRGSVPVDMRLQLRLETHFLDEFAAAEAARVARQRVFIMVAAVGAETSGKSAGQGPRRAAYVVALLNKFVN